MDERLNEINRELKELNEALARQLAEEGAVVSSSRRPGTSFSNSARRPPASYMIWLDTSTSIRRLPPGAAIFRKASSTITGV